MMRKLLPMAAVLALLAVAAPARAATTSPDEWASGVCSSVQTWLDSVEDTVSGLTSASSLDAAATQAKTGIEDATDTLKTSISDLGTPSTGDGQKAKQSVDKLTNQLDSLSVSIQTLLSNPGSNPVQVAGTLAEVGSDLGKAASDVKSTATTLKGLKPKGALKQAFQTEPACTKLKKSL